MEYSNQKIRQWIFMRETYLIFNQYKVILLPSDIIKYIWSFIDISDIYQIINRLNHNSLLDTYITNLQMQIRPGFILSSNALMLINYLINKLLIDILVKATLLSNNAYNMVISYHNVYVILKFHPFVLLNVKNKNHPVFEFTTESLLEKNDNRYKLRSDLTLYNETYVRDPSLAALKLINTILHVITEEIIISTTRMIFSNHLIITFDDVLKACITDRTIKLVYCDLFI